MGLMGAPCWNVDWLDFGQSLCRSQQLFCVHECSHPVTSRRCSFALGLWALWLWAHRQIYSTNTCRVGLVSNKEAVGDFITIIHLLCPLASLVMPVIFIIHRVHSWVRLLASFPPAACISPSGTLKAGPQGGSFLVNSHDSSMSYD